MVLNKTTLVIGASQRTTPVPIETLAKNLFFKEETTFENIIVLSIPLVIGVAYVAILAYIHYDVFGKSPSYEGTRQNFIKNELYFQKTEDCFQKIVQCCLPDSVGVMLCLEVLSSNCPRYQVKLLLNSNSIFFCREVLKTQK